MADRYLIETSATDGYLLEDGSGVLLMQEGSVIYQSVFRARNDDGNETTATWIAAQNTDWSQAPDVNFRIRMAYHSPDLAWNANGVELEYSHNGGAWTNVRFSTDVVIGANSPHVADAAATTQQITGLPGSFTGGQFSEDAHIGWPASDIPAGGWTEHEWVLQIVGADVAPGDVIQVRTTKDSGAVLDGYTATPSITVSSGAVDVSHSVPLLVVTATDLDVTVEAGADHSVGLQLVASSTFAGTVEAGTGHPVPLLTVPVSLFTGSVEAGADVAVPLQAVPVSVFAHSAGAGVDVAVPLQSFASSLFALTVAEGAGHSVPLQLVASGTMAGTVVTGADHAVPLQTVPVLVFTHSADGAISMSHAVNLLTLPVSTLAATVAAGSNYAVPLQTVGASVTPVAAVTGAGHTVPLLTVSTGLLAVLVDTGGTNIAVALQTIRLLQNNGQPMTMYLVRINNGIVTRERYQVPLG